MSRFLFDTHALIWWVDGVQLSPKIVDQLSIAMGEQQLFYSAVTFWEIGMMERKNAYNFLPTFQVWSENAMRQSGASCLPLSPQVALLSSRLPSDFHKDPGDRLLVASAIDADATFVTRDAKILDWAARTGALKVLAI